MALKFLINRSGVAAKFLVALRAAKPSALDTMGCLLEVADGKVSLTTSDREMTIRATAAAQGTIDGRVILPVGKFAEVFRNLPGDISVVELVGNRLVVKSGSSVFRIPTLGESSFMAATDPLIELKPLSTKVFEVADAVSFSSVRRASEEGKFSAMGVVVRKALGKTFIFANNEHRGCFSLLPEEAVSFTSVVLPMVFLDAVMDCGGGDVLFGDGVNLIRATAGDDFDIVCRKRVFTPPAVEKIYDKFSGQDLGSKHILKVEASALSAACKSSGLFNVGEDKVFPCRLRGVDNGFMVESLNYEDSGVQSLVKAERSDMNVIVSARYIKEFISSVDAKVVEIGYTSNSAPLIMRGMKGEDVLTYTISPINK